MRLKLQIQTVEPHTRIPFLREEVSRQENLRSPAVQRKKGTDKQEREANQCKVETRKITLPRFHSLDPVCFVFVQMHIECGALIYFFLP